MRKTGAVLMIVVAALLVCCEADSNQESEKGSAHSVERFDTTGDKAEVMAHPGGVSRQVREAGYYGFVPYLISRRLSNQNPYGGRRDQLLAALGGYHGDGLSKRNFDEIDLSDLNTFVGKRNFDEIDQTSMPFPYAKRFYHRSNLDKMRYRLDYPTDEVDLSSFPIASKGALDGFQLHQ